MLTREFRRQAVVQQFADVAQFVGTPAKVVARWIGLIAGFQLVGHDADNAFDGVQRHRVLLLAALHHQRAIDRHGKRQANLKPRALPRRRVDDH